MEIKASVKNIKIGRLKCAPAVNLIRGKSTGAALNILSLQNKKISRILYKLLQSAAANAEQKKTIDVDRLYIKTIHVDSSRHRKSFLPRARGRASSVLKKTSHIHVVLDEKVKGKGR